MSRHNSINHDENYRHLSYGQQQAIEEPRAFHPPNVSPRILHPAAHPPQQNAVMVDIHDQVSVLEYKQKVVEGVSFDCFFFFPRKFSRSLSTPD